MATVEELVITLLYQSKGVEARLDEVKKKLDDIEKSNSGAQKALDSTSASAKKNSDAMKGVADATSKAGQEADKAGDKTGKFGAVFDATTGKMEKGAKKMLVSYMMSIISAGAILSTVKGIISQTLDTAMALGKVSRASGETRLEVNALTKAFKSLGLEQEDAAAFMNSWGDARTEARLGRRNDTERAFNQVGIRTREKDGSLRSGGDVLFEAGQKAVADSGGDKNLAQKRLQNLGIDEATARAAVNGTKELLEAKRADNKVTEEQIEKAEKVAKAYKAFQGKIDDVKNAIGAGMLPMVEAIVNGLEELFGSFENSGEALEGFGKGLTFVGGIMMAVATGPFGVIIGAATALLGILQMTEAWTGTGGTVVQGFFIAFGTILGWVKNAIDIAIAGIEGLINGLDMLGVAIDNLAGGKAVHKEIKLSVPSAGSGGAKAPAPAKYGAVRGGYGLSPAGSGGGRGGRGGGRGGRGGGSGSAKEEPVYHSRYQGTADPRKLGIESAKGKIAEDPAKAEAKAQKAKGGAAAHVGAGAKQVASGAVTYNFNNSIVVNAQGNTNAQQIANKTADAVNTVSRRQAGAMV